jgi:transposase
MEMNREVYSQQSVKEFEALKEHGVRSGDDRSKASLYRHRQAIAATGSALSVVKRKTGTSKVDEEKLEEISEFILDKNSKKEKINRRIVQKMIYDTWGIQVTPQTVSNLFGKLGMSRKKSRTRTEVSIKSQAELEEEYMAFVTMMKKKRVWNVDPSMISSLDFTYTRDPTVGATTVSPIGSGKIQVKSKRAKYTDCIATWIWADGVNHTRPKIYSHNPRMSLEQKNTPRGREIKAHLVAMMEKYDVEEDDIVYVKSTKQYCRETPAILEDYVNSQDVPSECLIMHDGGGCYKSKETVVLESLGFTNTVVYPKDVHQWLSPNDNNLHGCKSTWAAKWDDLEDDVERSLQLLSLIALDTTKNAKYYFKRNLFNVTPSRLGGVMKG